MVPTSKLSGSRRQSQGLHDSWRTAQANGEANWKQHLCLSCIDSPEVDPENKIHAFLEKNYEGVLKRKEAKQECTI